MTLKASTPIPPMLCNLAYGVQQVVGIMCQRSCKGKHCRYSLRKLWRRKLIYVVRAPSRYPGGRCQGGSAVSLRRAQSRDVTHSASSSHPGTTQTAAQRGFSTYSALSAHTFPYGSFSGLDRKEGGYGPTLCHPAGEKRWSISGKARSNTCSFFIFLRTLMRFHSIANASFRILSPQRPLSANLSP